MADDIIRFIGSTRNYLYQEMQELKKECDELNNWGKLIFHPLRTVLRRLRMG